MNLTVMIIFRWHRALLSSQHIPMMRLDYLFALIENETLEGTFNQYKSPRLMWEAFLRHKERIARERPELHT